MLGALTTEIPEGPSDPPADVGTPANETFVLDRKLYLRTEITFSLAGVLTSAAGHAISVFQHLGGTPSPAGKFDAGTLMMYKLSSTKFTKQKNLY
jgi:hypothetical protein